MVEKTRRLAEWLPIWLTFKSWAFVQKLLEASISKNGNRNDKYEKVMQAIERFDKEFPVTLSN